MQKKWAYLLLGFLVLVTAWLGSTLPYTTFDYDFDKFFKPDDEATSYFENHRNTFGTDNDFVLIGIVSKNGVFNQPFYDKLADFTSALEDAPHVIRVISPTSLRLPVREPMTGALLERPVLSPYPERDSLRVLGDPALADNLFSKDTTAVSIVLLTTQRLGKEKSDELASGLEEICQKFEFDGLHLGGRALGQVVYINKIQKEFAFFMLLAVLIVVALLYVMFKSFRGIILPLATVLLAVVWSIGILNLTGSGIGILLSMLPPVIFVVGMSDAVHLYARYLEELSRGQSQAYALRKMVFDTGLATLLTSVTTAIGFASLYFTGIPTLQEFGLLTAAGVLAAYVIAIIMMPAWLSLTAPPEKTLKHRTNNLWEPFLENLYPKVLMHRRKLFGVLLALTAIFAVSTSQLGLNNYLLEDLRPGEKLRQDFTFFDQYFAGVRPFEVGIKTREGHLLTADHLQQVDAIAHYLDTVYGASALNSPASTIRALHRSRSGGGVAAYTLPDDERMWRLTLSDFAKLQKMGKVATVVDSTGTYGRIHGRVGDWGAQAFAAKNEAFTDFLEAEGLNEVFEVEVTGTGTLIDRTNQNLVYSLAKGLGVAFILISLIMGAMFRSVKMVAIALVPNILPLLAVASMMFYLGIDLKMSTGIIFTIAFGIAVDDTIHLLSRYKLEQIKGKNNREALRQSFVHTGKALIVTSIILFGGFISLCFSSFQSTFYIGLFVTMTLLFALVFDLSLLPALVSLLPEKNSNPGLDPPAQHADYPDEQGDTEGEVEVPGHRSHGT